jgi:hypothetical protein
MLMMMMIVDKRSVGKPTLPMREKRGSNASGDTHTRPCGLNGHEHVQRFFICARVIAAAFE